MPRRVIAIETSSRHGSVAAAQDRGNVQQINLTADRRHTSELLPAVRSLCKGMEWDVSDISAVYFSRGPGSFTGLRVAATVARMLQWSLGCQVVAVPTMEVIARNTQAWDNLPRRIAVILDAKRGQVFGALFERLDSDELNTIEEAALRDPGEWFATIGASFCVIGEGISQHCEACAAAGAAMLDEPFWLPSAANVIAIGDHMLDRGEVCRPADITPLYIRRPEAEEVYEQRRAEARRRRGE